MTRDQLIQLLQFRLEGRDDIGPRILLELDFTQRHVLEESEWLPWFLMEKGRILPEGIVDGGFSLPENFLSEVPEEGFLWYDGRELDRITYQDGMELYKGHTTKGAPRFYCPLPDRVLLFPTPMPEWEMPLDILFYGRDILMSEENEETKWLRYASDLVLAYVGYQLATKHIQNATLAQSFLNDVTPARTRLLAKDTTWRESNLTRVMGDVAGHYFFREG